MPPSDAPAHQLVFQTLLLQFRLLKPGQTSGMNRYFRRLHRFGKRFSAQRSHGKMPAPQGEPPPDPRKKSDRHGKVTADKWNQ